MFIRSAFQLSKIRLFFIAQAQSSLGSYVSYIALVVLADQRFHSPAKLSLLLLAEFIPAIIVGGYLGHMIDRRSRRRAVVTADCISAAAFVGMALFSSFPLMFTMALLAGISSALFIPAIQSGLPNLASGNRLASLHSIQSTISSAASVVGPLIAGVLLAVIEPAWLLLLNALTFAISAVIISTVPLDGTRSDSVMSEPVAFRSSVKLPRGFWGVVSASGLVALFAGMLGVAEVYFALDYLHAGPAGLAVLIAGYGVGMVGGNYSAGRDRWSKHPAQSFAFGLILIAAGLIGTAFSPFVPLAVIAFGVAGAGNGFVAVNSRLLVVQVVDKQRQGIAYGIKDSFESAGIAVALLSGGLLVGWIGARNVFILAGLGVLATLIGSVLAFRRINQAPAHD